MKKTLLALITLPWRMLTALRRIIANLLMLVVVLVLLAAFAGNGDKSQLPKHAVLDVHIGQNIVEQRTYGDAISELLSNDSNQPRESVLHELTSAIRWAADDNHITGIVLHTDDLQGSDLGTLESLAQAIITFRRSGKPVIAVGDNFSQGQYYLASTADRIYLNPMGSVQLTGFGAYQNYFHDLLEKLAVNVHVFRVGEYKSFVEPFVRNDMSPEARENLQQWLDEQWAFYSHAIEERRKLPPGALNRYINSQDTLLASHDNNPATLAQAYGLIDGTATREQAEDLVDNLDKHSAGKQMDAEAYFHHRESLNRASELLDNNRKVAVIHASGEMVDGEQPPGTVGSETLIKQIRSARDDDDVAAVVLRIDSPGGSVFAAELIRAELAGLQADGKPLVVSMGGVAASGGYWIAANADQIWASPATITGSIGVFGVMPTFENTIEKIGMHSDGYKTTELGDALQLDRPLNPLAGRVLQQGVEFTYREFLKLVSTGRKSTPQAVDRIAQGRVWTGAHAQKIGLVDHLGELDDAIAAAAGLADIKQYDIQYIEPEKSPMAEILDTFSASDARIENHLLKALARWPALASLASSVKPLQHMNDPNHVYVRCMECAISF